MKPDNDSSSTEPDGPPSSTPRPAYAVDRFDAWCPDCDYNLRGNIKLRGSVCPECGADLRFDQMAFAAPPSIPRRALTATGRPLGRIFRFLRIRIWVPHAGHGLQDRLPMRRFLFGVGVVLAGIWIALAIVWWMRHRG